LPGSGADLEQLAKPQAKPSTTTNAKRERIVAVYPERLAMATP
jgi:hypothetical protein